MQIQRLKRNVVATTTAARKASVTAMEVKEAHNALKNNLEAHQCVASVVSFRVAVHIRPCIDVSLLGCPYVTSTRIHICAHRPGGNASLVYAYLPSTKHYRHMTILR